jgi:hypothetical protein
MTDPQVAIAVRTITVTIVFRLIARGITARPLATHYVATIRQQATAPGSRTQSATK